MSCLNLNKVVLAGRLTNDPELKQTASGVSVMSFTIAVNRRYASKNDQGESQNQADFISVVAWRNTAEFIAKYFRKGSAICITGSIQTRNWQDQQGQRRYTTEVVADEAMFVDSRSESAATDAYVQTPLYASPNAVAPNFEEHNTDDDLPF
jgi:single-strand DNA-binding protein